MPLKFQLISHSKVLGNTECINIKICRRYFVYLLDKVLTGQCAYREPFVLFLQRSHCFLLFCGKIGSYDLSSFKLT